MLGDLLVVLAYVAVGAVMAGFVVGAGLALGALAKAIVAPTPNEVRRKKGWTTW